VIRERALKVVLVLVGLLFSVAIYPVTEALWKMDQSDYGDEIEGFLVAVAVLVIIGVVLIVLAPGKQAAEQASNTPARRLNQVNPCNISGRCSSSERDE
jgi:predicted PurR-regulated permease PerM